MLQPMASGRGAMNLTRSKASFTPRASRPFSSTTALRCSSKVFFFFCAIRVADSQRAGFEQEEEEEYEEEENKRGAERMKVLKAPLSSSILPQSWPSLLLAPPLLSSSPWGESAQATLSSRSRASLEFEQIGLGDPMMTAVLLTTPGHQQQ